jgi:meiotic recombination protein REC8
MALRLQSNLLYVISQHARQCFANVLRYGVSRVYDQQCQYVLKDAQHAQDHMRQMLKVVKNSDLDLEAGKATRPEHFLLQDDPNFMPDLAFTNLAMDLDFNLAAPDLISDHGSSQSSTLLSPHNLRMSPAPSIHIPTSGNDFYGGIGGLGGFSGDDESRGRLSSLAPGYVNNFEHVDDN